MVYDVRFSAVAPGKDGTIGLIINIEAQSKYHPGYPLVKRAIYYCGRMLSAQYGSVFTQSHYGEIQKVYSIWICSHPPKERENTITSYTLQERHLVGQDVYKRQTLGRSHSTDELYPRDRCIIAEAAGDCNRFLSQFPAAPEKI